MTVIGVALNFRETVARLADSFQSPPYVDPPRAPILYIKTPNTWISSGQPIRCPAHSSRLRAAGTLGLVIGRPACRLRAADAFDCIAAFAVVNDLSIPHESFYRPALRERCFDTSCVIGAASPMTPARSEMEIDILINGIRRSKTSTASLVRSIPKLLEDITEFMTLQPRDILLIGEPDDAPLCGPGDTVRVEIAGLGAIENPVDGE